MFENELINKEEDRLQTVSHISKFADEIEGVVSKYSKVDASQSNEINDINMLDFSNGKTNLALQHFVPLNTRKKAGIFFTGSILADKVADFIAPLLKEGAKVIDPACGAGNLLISCAKHLPVGKSLTETLSNWSNVLYGYDLHYQFVRIARIRLFLLAASLHKEIIPVGLPVINSEFHGIKIQDTLRLKRPTSHADCVVVNPPFGYIIAPGDCQWAAGKIQIAAIFIEKILSSAPKGQHIVAILPDVLRSGTRYKKWRNIVSELASHLDIEIIGRFDDKTDVDVFILHMVIGKSNKKFTEWYSEKSRTSRIQLKISDLFEVSVGPVVPYRCPHKGNWYPYLDTSSAIPWSIVSKLPVRRFKGTVTKPPFVVVRRTSNPGDKYRAVASIVTGSSPIAVENHLIVLKPRNGTIKQCIKLIEFLRGASANQWFNERIRCRHLTVSSVKEMPLMEQ
jgi:hypothetical protein